MQLPVSLSINAWHGAGAPSSALGPNAIPWALGKKVDGDLAMALGPPVLPDLRDWGHPDVGWGLVLPDIDPGISANRARADDAPKPIQKLVATRGDAPVLRYRKGDDGYLVRYKHDGSFDRLSVPSSAPGIADGRIPQYLLIFGGPDVIPWRLQYALSLKRYVGRLALDGDALENYIDALINDWPSATCDRGAPVTWSVAHSAQDITGLMDRSISRPLWDSFSADTDLVRRKGLFDGKATTAELLTALKEQKPALITTTSHGLTGPPNAMLKSQLGAMVDVQGNTLDVKAAAANTPSGSIWYAHACCSAGGEANSRYLKLFTPPPSLVHQVLTDASTGAGTCIAPLPQLLLGSATPIRAFVGHVEPTFDWTLKDPYTQQVVTHTLHEALYARLHQPDRASPIGWALASVYDDAGAHFGQWKQAVEDSNSNVPAAETRALFHQLVAMDRQGVIILGDPTVTLQKA